MPKNIQLKIILCPHNDFKDDPADKSWPCPAKVAVALIKSDNTRIKLGQTRKEGETTLKDVDPDTYTVEIPGSGLKGDLDLTAAHDGETREVRLIPRDRPYLLVLRLTEQPADTGVSNAQVKITKDKDSDSFTANGEGFVYAAVPAGEVSIQPQAKQELIPEDPELVQEVEISKSVVAHDINYWPRIQVSAKPTVKMPDGSTSPLIDTRVTVEYRGSATFSRSYQTKTLETGDALNFEFLYPGIYRVVFDPPASFQGLPIKETDSRHSKPRTLKPGGQATEPAEFTVAATQQVQFLVKIPVEGQQLKGDVLHLQVVGPDDTVRPVDVKAAQPRSMLLLVKI